MRDKYLDIRKAVSSILREESMAMGSEDEMEAPQSFEDILKTFEDMETFVKDEKTQSNTALQNAMRLAGSLKDPNQKNAANNNIKVQKERLKKLDTMNKTVADQKKSVEDSFKKKQTAPQTTSQISASISEIAQMNSQLPAPAPEQTPVPPIAKSYVVKFDTKTENPFSVKFSERGFSVEGTRLSFEALENALSKNYSIVLNNGKGLVLDAIRMQKILKYKDKWY